MRKKVIVVLADHDNSAGHPSLNEIKIKNGALFDYIANKINRHVKNGVACEVVFGIGSARQSYSVDQLNAARRDLWTNADTTGSCVDLLPGLMTGLAETLEKNEITNVSITPFYFLLPDMYNDLPEGTTYKSMKKPEDSNEHDQPEFIFDEQKITLLYAFIHTLLKKFLSDSTNPSFECYFFDDMRFILETCKRFFSTLPEYLPKKCQLNLVRYEKDNDDGTGEIKTDFPITCIEGNGEIQNDVRSFILNLIKKAFPNLATPSRDWENYNLSWKNIDFDQLRETPVALVAASGGSTSLAFAISSSGMTNPENLPTITKPAAPELMSPITQLIMGLIQTKNFAAAYNLYGKEFNKLASKEREQILNSLTTQSTESNNIFLRGFFWLDKKKSEECQQNPAYAEP